MVATAHTWWCLSSEWPACSVVCMSQHACGGAESVRWGRDIWLPAMWCMSNKWHAWPHAWPLEH